MYYKKLDELRQETNGGAAERPEKPLVEDDKIKSMTKKQLKHLKKKLKKKKKKLKQKNNEIERQIIECENQMQVIEESKANEHLNRSKSKSKDSDKSIEEQLEPEQPNTKLVSKPEIAKSNAEFCSPKPLLRAKSLQMFNRSQSTKRDRLHKNLVYLKQKLEDDLKVMKLHGVEELAK